jgi:phospholipase C
MNEIEHVIIIVKENHTFDSYFGTFPGANGMTLPREPNPPPHDYGHRHADWTARSTGAQQAQYIEADIPKYFEYARDYTLCDNYFSEVAGPSTPNHLMLICADSPCINNPTNMYRPRPGSAYALASLPSALEKHHRTWGNYGGYAFHYVKDLAGHPGNHSRDLFAHHAAAGTLPTVSWVYGDGRPDLSEHPTQNVTDGMRWTEEQVNAVVAGGLWDHSVIFITWDDWGGWADHVVPPDMEQWNPAHAQHPNEAYPAYKGDQFRFGSRVPCLVLSPYAKPGHISSQENSHVSLVKFVEDTFGLPPLNSRDAAANAMTDCFDYTQTPLAPPSKTP